ncbi:transposase [Streptomyces zaomyceticus]|uniref:transposase n=1 Tax=Streptomyces zaomyceticus TaxID=68286 RepID=UPI00342084F9
MEQLLPDPTPKRGGRWREHRQVIDAIAWKSQTDSPWGHLLTEYGSWKGVYTRAAELGNGRHLRQDLRRRLPRTSRVWRPSAGKGAASATPPPRGTWPWWISTPRKGGIAITRGRQAG